MITLAQSKYVKLTQIVRKKTKTSHRKPSFAIIAKPNMQWSMHDKFVEYMNTPNTRNYHWYFMKKKDAEEAFVALKLSGF